MRWAKNIFLLLCVVCIILFSLAWGEKLVIMHQAKVILEREIGQRYKEFRVDSIRKEEKQIEIHFINKDLFTLSSEFLVILNEDGTSEIVGN